MQERSTSKGPIWISHRGLKIKYVENTMLAFKAAVEDGYTHLETDLRSTQDGEIVLVHDPDLSRLLGRAQSVEGTSA